MISQQKIKLNIKVIIILVAVLEILALSFSVTYAQTTSSTSSSSSSSNIRAIDFTAYIVNNQNKEITNGEYEVRFAIYRTDRTNADPYPSNSDARVWEETQKIDLHDGVLKARIGEVKAIPDNINFNDGTFYLGIRLGEDSEMVPRKKIGATALSLNSFRSEIARNSEALEGHVTGTSLGNIPLLGSGGKFATSVLPTITSLGTVGSGTWEADAIANEYIEDALTGKTYNGLELAESSNGFSITGGSRKLTIKDTNIILNQSLATSDSPTFSSINLTDTLGIASGGTGLGNLGTANQILGVNSNATGLEYKTLTAGANITITHGVNSLTIAATSGTNYTAGGTLLELTGTTFSLKEGTLTDTRICTYSTTAGLVCNTQPSAVGVTYTAGNDLDLTGTQFDLESTLDIVSTINLAGTGTLNGLDAIDATGETTLEAALDIAGDVTGTGLNAVTIASGFTRDTEWDSQSELETIWGSTLATDAELSAHNHSGTYEPVVSTGTANYIWGMNAAGNAKEWKQLMQGSNISITHGAGSVTIAATDTNTTYTAGNDLDLTGTQFDLESQLDYVSIINRTSANLTLQTTTSGDILLSPAGNVGIGAASPGEKLEVTGNIKLNGNLVNDGNNRAIGAASNRFTYGYFENLDVTNMSVGGVDISGSTSNTFTVNSDNVSADGEDGSIGFERGSVTPNAIIGWDSVNDEFDFNFPLNVTGTITATGGNSTNWNSAYTYRLTGASGTAPLTLTLNANNLTGSIADATDLTKGVASFSSSDFLVAAGAVSIVSGLTRDAEWDSQGEVETIWGTTLTNDSEWNTQSEVETIWGTTLTNDSEWNTQSEVEAIWGVTLTTDSEWDSAAEINAATTDADFSLTTHNHSGTYEPIVSTGTANYIWGMNAAGNAKEWKQLVQGSNVTITHGAGSVTIAATDTNTTYTAGNDLDLTGTQFDLESQLDYVSTINRTSADLTLQTTTSGNIILSPAGNVGIGTTSPLGLLSIGAGSLADGNLPVQISTGGAGTERWFAVNKNGAYGLLMGYENAGSLGTGAFIRQITGDPIYFVVNNTTIAQTILSNGNIGIGTTSPAEKLAINGAVVAGGNVDGVYDVTGVHIYDTGSVGRVAALANGSARQIDIQGSPITFWTGSTYSEKMRIDASGYVGIGTTSPGTKLDVSGVITATGGTSTNWNTAYSHSSATTNVHGLTFTAEGSGGGLDADLLDGQHNSYYTDIPGRLGYTPLKQDGTNHTFTNLTDTTTAASWVYGMYPGAVYANGYPLTYGHTLTIKGGTNTSLTSLLMGWDPAPGLYYRSGRDASQALTAWKKIWYEDNDGSSSGLDADLLDGYQYNNLPYVTGEADTLATVTARGFMTRGSSGAFAVADQATPGLEVYGAGTTNPAFITFHRPGVYAVKFGLDGADLKVGGWSMGAVAYKLWHEGNDGSGSGLDADTLDGFNSSAFGDATAANQTTILSRIGTPNPTAKGTDTVFNYLKKIDDNNGLYKRVFVTSTSYQGNLGGLAGADAICQTRANAASLGGTWKAIISASDNIGENAATRIGYKWMKLLDTRGRIISEAYNGTTSTQSAPWGVRSSGSSSYYLLNPIAYDEFGNYVNSNVWTGSTTAGLVHTYDCTDWTSAGGSAINGVSTSNTTYWINDGLVDDCGNYYRLYCIEQ